MSQESLEKERKTDLAVEGTISDDVSEHSNEEVFAFEESRKMGVTSAVFLILNKIIGTGSKCGLK